MRTRNMKNPLILLEIGTNAVLTQSNKANLKKGALHLIPFESSLRAAQYQI